MGEIKGVPAIFLGMLSRPTRRGKKEETIPNRTTFPRLATQLDDGITWPVSWAWTGMYGVIGVQ